MKSFQQDLMFALRQLRRAPAFAAIAIITLALAIGVSTAVFSVLEATVIRPLPFDHPDRIMVLQTYSGVGYHQPASWPDYVDWRRINRSFSALAGFQPTSANLQAGTSTTPVQEVSTTDNFFEVFGVQPLLGRTFLPGEQQAGRNDIAVLSFELWQSSFGADKAVVGSTVRLDGKPTVVVGVMPAGFRCPLQITNAVYQPLHLPTSQLTGRGSHFMPVMGRLKPGVSQESAEAELNQIFTDLSKTYEQDLGEHVKLQPAAEEVLARTRQPLRVLTLAVLGVLLIGCVNVGGLLLARGARRQRELGLRSAVGAGRMRLVRQMLTEALVLSLLGAAGGVLVAVVLLRVMQQLVITALARGTDVHVNVPVLLATALIAILSGLLAGLLPALQSARIAPAAAMQSGGRNGATRGQTRLRSGMLVSQIAIALGLLVASGLLLRHLTRVRSVDLGFEPQHLISEDLYVNTANYHGRDMLTNFYNPLLDRVRALPGVQSAGVIDLLPVDNYGSNSDITVVGHPPPPPHQEYLSEIRSIVPGTMEALGVHLLKGRTLNADIDRLDAPMSALINEAFAHKYFSAGEPVVGQQIDWGGSKVTIVGVVSNLRQDIEEAPMAEMDISITQVPAEYASQVMAHNVLVVRAVGDPLALTGALREALHQTDASVPFREPQTMKDVIAKTLSLERLESWLFGIFAGLALTLALVGIYGSVHHEVELRTREIGVRMALGSSRGQIAKDILARTAGVVGVGLAVGWLLTLALGRVIGSVVALDPASNKFFFVALTFVLGVCGLLASVVPARYAASLDPVEALRAE